VYAKNVMAKAGELSIELSPEEQKIMSKVAGAEYGDRVDAQIMLRKKEADGNDARVASLDKIAEAAHILPPDQFAKLLEAYDNDSGIKSEYGRHIVDPYQATFDKQFSKEAGYVWEDEQSGMSMSGKELEKAAEEKFDKIKGYFGVTLANSLKKHGSEVFESLPTDAKTVIAQIAKGRL